MKKFMIAAAIACAAAISQAASVSWSATLVKNGSAGESNNGIAYLMLANNVSDFASLSGKGAEAVNAALKNALISYLPGTAGNYKHESVANADLGLEDAKSWGDAYLVIFDTASVSDTSKFFVTNAKELVTLTGDNDSGLAFGSQSAASKLDTNWHSVAGQPGPGPAPEPTSGLMLLLGMAGLALRRRRA